MTQAATQQHGSSAPPAEGLFSTSVRILDAAAAEGAERDAYKARFMKDYNLLRRQTLLKQLRDQNGTPSTEMQHVAAYAMAFPHCHYLPVSVSFGTEEGAWLIELNYYDQEPAQAALAIIAMLDITSLPVRVDAFGDGKGGVSCSDADIQNCRTEIDLLKRFSLWRPERCLAIVRGEASLTRF